MAEVIRWHSNPPDWELTIKHYRSREILWTITSPTDLVPKGTEFACPKSAIPEIIAALTKLALEGEE